MANWQLDASHSEVSFRVRHLMVSTVSGNFGSFASEADMDGDNLENAAVSFTIDVASISTGVTDRDHHLRSDDFFAADKFPQIVFKGTKMSKESEGKYALDGELTIRDVTKPVRFDVEFGGIVTDPYGQTKAGFEVSGKIMRKEYGLMWDAVTEAGGIVVSDEVKFLANLQYVKGA